MKYTVLFRGAVVIAHWPNGDLSSQILRRYLVAYYPHGRGPLFSERQGLKEPPPTLNLPGGRVLTARRLRPVVLP